MRSTTYRRQERHTRRALRLSGIRRREDGVSGAITAMLLILIIGSVVGLIYSVYIPMWTKSAEADQMAETQRQFLAMKETLDTQVVAPEEAIGTTVTTRVALGTDGGPIFGVGGTTGQLEVDPLEGRVEVYDRNDPDETYGLGRGTIGFESSNQHYIQQQITYELGAVFIAQNDGAVMKVPPHFLARNTTRGDLEVSLTVPALVGDNQQVSGTGSYVIKSTLKVVNSNDFSFTDQDIQINLTTAYPELWEEYFESHLDNSTLVGAEYNVTVDVANNRVLVDVFGVDRLRVNVAVLEMELI